MKLKQSPIEVVYILEKGKLELQSFYKYIFSDLLLMGVLKIEISPDRDIEYVLVGPNFGKEYPKKHELPFLTPFVQSKSLKITFSGYAKLVVASSMFHMRKYVEDSSLVNKFFKKSIITRLFRLKSLNKLGKKYKVDVEDYLLKSKAELSQSIKCQPSMAMKLLTELEGNIFLLPNWNMSEIDKMDEDYLRKLRGLKPYREYTDFSWLIFPKKLFVIPTKYYI